MAITELPKSFRDAIALARRLSVRYIWINPLCRIQEGDSGADWKHEVNLMHMVSTMALCTISAARAVEPPRGLFFSHDHSLLPPVEVRMNFDGKPCSEQALKHQWMKQYLLSTIQHSPPPADVDVISATDSITEAFATWDAISSFPQPAKTNALLANKNGDRQQAQVPNLARSTPEQVRGQVKTQLKVTYDLEQLNGHKGSVMSVALSPNGTIISSSSMDESVRVWDAATGRKQQQLDGHRGLWSVAFSPDGTTIASGSLDRSVRVWDAAIR
jgi:Heterokaryon incompatibility protein (HET)/WD domain, G-beta repeat